MYFFRKYRLVVFLFGIYFKVEYIKDLRTLQVSVKKKIIFIGEKY